MLRWTPGSGSAALALAAVALLSAGCGGRGGPSCDDAAFRSQDEELYVARATVGNALAGGGDPAILLRDLGRARAALGGYLDAHPPCAERLMAIETTEREGLGALDEAIARLSGGADAGSQLRRALRAFRDAQAALGAVG